ncbi:MAG: hypothetical protein A2289_06380 [Deltaproteobacteria bacterium RIFOXYA12_FULL_58_15]|nr:MAG: hypothetical protein A2289_06380 [Deltaproteobacteria bacterium RIFOXYA12_FULL_58_15]OGR11680.1 MAG: hypothetical protein A2341_02360 [Deltaproteobacteria bacterium RIFOXYB12_FULL_58_9]
MLFLKTISSTVLLLTLFAAQAKAQDLPNDATGFKVGDGRLHPYLQVDSRFVANPGRQSGGGTNDVVLVARPGLDFVLPSDALDFKLNGDVEWRQYMNVGDEDTSKLSTLMGQAALDAQINKQGAVGFGLHERFQRTADPGNQTVTARLLRVTNDAGLGIDLRPGGGALVFSPSYNFIYERYDRPESEADPGTYLQDPENLDSMTHLPKLRASWKFLPKTALFVEAEGQLTVYPNAAVDTNVDTNIFLAQVGAAGSVTQKIALLLKAGYGGTFISADNLGADANFNSVVGQAEFNYLASETMRFRAGALRTVKATPLFKYFDLVRGYVGYDQTFGAFQVGAKLSYDYMIFATAVSGPTSDRNDGNFQAELSLAYRATEWLTVSLTERADSRSSDYSAGADSPQFDYFMNDLFLRISARY